MMFIDNQTSPGLNDTQGGHVHPGIDEIWEESSVSGRRGKPPGLEDPPREEIVKPPPGSGPGPGQPVTAGDAGV